ncbi:MAG: fumarylacetoacetate hydrolase family protein [Hyphomicrobiales bacterium]|jgi:2-keto-4-pentenoate hydratase/2-oxohepta-3-ene-1,7-dioic acid hydratase in catechol pathway|nr:fumarylacetoacetate hydrolase family protein [Hyphomicrobiales bacterium]
MKLATVRYEGRFAAAAMLQSGSALRLADAARLAGGSPEPFGSLQTIIEGGDTALAHIRQLVASAAAHHSAIIQPADVKLAAPLPHPRKNVFCVGRNYVEHIAEGERAQNIKVGISEHPVFFTKPATAVVGPGDTVPLFAHVSRQIDYEVELAVIIGKAGRDISREDALRHVWGYTIINDVTARDVQRRHGGQYFKGKGLDGSCPMGPWIVTADGVRDPGNLAIRLRVNGDLRQDGRTSAMIFDIPTLIASLSEGLTLEPGDVIATGTPSGVGYAMTPPCFLKDGDVVECEVEGIGTLSNNFRTASSPQRAG